MRRKLHLGAVVGLLLVVASVTVASASSSDSRSSHGDVEVMRVTAIEVAEGYVDANGDGFGLGDQFPFTNDLYQAGKRIGEDGGSCTVVRIGTGGDFTVQCLGTNSLPQGTFAVQGLIRYVGGVAEKPFRLGIVGGTRGYRDARGQVIGRVTSSTELSLTFQIIR